MTDIKYLKRATGFKAGQIRKVSPREADILVKLGIAELVDDVTEKPRTKRKYQRKDLRAED